MTPEPTPLVTVLPCDREAAAKFYPFYNSAEETLRGDHDNLDLVQAFAHHRSAALEEAAKVAENDAAEVYPTSVSNRRHLEVCVSIATAIRALSNKTGEGHPTPGESPCK